MQQEGSRKDVAGVHPRFSWPVGDRNSYYGTSCPNLPTTPCHQHWRYSLKQASMRKFQSGWSVLRERLGGKAMQQPLFLIGPVLGRKGSLSLGRRGIDI